MYYSKRLKVHHENSGDGHHQPTFANELPSPAYPLGNPSIPAKEPFVLVDTGLKMVELINTCSNLPKSPPSLFLDIGGVNLGSRGSISVIQVFIRPLTRTYLVDVVSIGEEVFAIKANKITFRDILEARHIPKVFFDLRHDSDALRRHYNVKLAGVQVLQC